ncbi:aldolase [Rhodobacterales bacterium HKCCE2091]|nr:aldolase [Rhodobacterales bacterium HKCCE2091]
MTGRISQQTALRDEIARIGASLFARGLTSGSTGNISAVTDDGSLLLTPTNSSLGTLDPARLSLMSPDGRLLDGDPPTKEAFLHASMYAHRPDDRAVVHLHSAYSVAVSIMDGLDPMDVLPPLTAYYVMRVGRLPLVPYFPPGDEALAQAVAALAGRHHAVLLANHGPVVSGSSLCDAQYAIEELEDTAKLFLLLAGHRLRPLTDAQRNELEARYRK